MDLPKPANLGNNELDGTGYNGFGDPKVGSSKILKSAEHFLT